jgi:hypothetical protein
MKLSRNVFSNDRTAGRSVCITKETTLKGIRVSDFQIHNCIFADQRSDTFQRQFINNLTLSITVRQIPDAVDTVVCAPDDGWRHHPKYV